MHGAAGQGVVSAGASVAVREIARQLALLPSAETEYEEQPHGGTAAADADGEGSRPKGQGRGVTEARGGSRSFGENLSFVIDALRLGTLR